MKPVRRAVIEKVVTYGYRGLPSTLVKLCCGHEQWFYHKMPWEVKCKTTICNQCTRKKYPECFTQPPLGQKTEEE